MILGEVLTVFKRDFPQKNNKVYHMLHADKDMKMYLREGYYVVEIWNNYFEISIVNGNKVMPSLYATYKATLPGIEGLPQLVRIIYQIAQLPKYSSLPDDIQGWMHDRFCEIMKRKNNEARCQKIIKCCDSFLPSQFCSNCIKIYKSIEN